MLEMRSVAPNPFGRSAEVLFVAREPGHVTLEIHDANGRCVRAVSLGHVERGTHRVRWDGRDASGRDVATGVYFMRLRGPAGGSNAAKAVLFR
jgi:flagellar hook assembly protein FlgD